MIHCHRWEALDHQLWFIASMAEMHRWTGLIGGFRWRAPFLPGRPSRNPLRAMKLGRLRTVEVHSTRWTRMYEISVMFMLIRSKVTKTDKVIRLV
jgi:hypothetical protein